MADFTTAQVAGGFKRETMRASSPVGASDRFRNRKVAVHRRRLAESQMIGAALQQLTMSSSALHHVDSLWPLVALSDLKLDVLAFV